MLCVGSNSSVCSGTSSSGAVSRLGARLWLGGFHLLCVGTRTRLLWDVLLRAESPGLGARVSLVGFHLAAPRRDGEPTAATVGVVRVSVITLFPRWFKSPLGVSVVARAIAQGALQVEMVDLRAHGLGRHRQVDDAPFGGGAGMVMMIEPIDRALAGLEGAHKVLFSPAGARLDQATLDRWARLDHLALVCGRYEGVDQRVTDNLVDEEISSATLSSPGASRRLWR